VLGPSRLRRTTSTPRREAPARACLSSDIVCLATEIA
jgi:hypothetical protein